MSKKLLFTMLLCVTALLARAQSVGLVLSGGGAKGFYHIGVIKALEENGIPIDYVSGTSMGSIIGGLYAAGMTPEQMQTDFTSPRVEYWLKGKIESKYKYFFKQMHHDASMLTLRFDPQNDVRRASMLPQNVIPSDQIDMAFIEYFSAATVKCAGNFDSLFIPFRCIATDAMKRREVIYRQGNLGKAIRTSMTIPLVFKPIKSDSTVLYDGGLYNNFPWQVLVSDFEPDILIGSKCVEGNRHPEHNSLMDQVFALTMMHTDYSLPLNGIMIDRIFTDVSMLDFSKAAEIIQAGYDDCMDKMEEIQARIARRVDPKQLSERREAFRSDFHPLLFGQVQIEGLRPRQKTYVTKLLGLSKENKAISLEEFRSHYFKILSEGEIEGDYPEVIYNPWTGLFDLKLHMHNKPSFKLKVGGNISSTALNQAYIGLEYRNIARSAHMYNLDGYFSPFYVSTALSMRTDFFLGEHFYYEAGISYNYYNYFRSDYGILSRMNDLAYAKYEDSYAKLAVGMPIGRHSALSLQGNAAIDNYRYLQSAKVHEKGDTLDRTGFNYLSAKIELERNDVNYYMYPTRGILQSASLIFVSGNESFTAGTTGRINGQHFDSRYRRWFGARYMREQYFAVNPIKWFSFGYYFDMVYSKHPEFMTPNATNITSPAFTPTPHSKVVYMKEFRASSYAGVGIMPIFEFTPNFYLRMSGYAFLPENRIGEKMDVKQRLRYMFDTSLVYQTMIGPVSLSMSKYDINKNNNLFITFNFGLAIFNKKGLFY